MSNIINNLINATQGTVLYFDGTDWNKLAPGIDGYALTTHGAGVNPTWGPGSGGGGGGGGAAVGGDLSGTLPNPNVIDFHLTGQLQGAIAYYNGTHWIVLPPGTDGYTLTTHGPSQNPSWTTPNLTVGGDLSGSLPNPNVINLHLVNQVKGSVLYFNGTKWVVLPPGNNGDVLTTHGINLNPDWEPPESVLPSALIGQMLYCPETDLGYGSYRPQISEQGLIVISVDGYILV